MTRFASNTVSVWGYLKVSEEKIIFNPRLLARSSSMEIEMCVLPLASGPAELLLQREPELIKHVSTDLTEGMRACLNAR